MTTIEPGTDPRTVLDPRTERSRLAILDAARELLQTDGPDAVTHAQVAAAANVSRTTVYKHHPTRADLIRAAIEVGKPFGDQRTGDLRTDLSNFVGHLVEEFADDDKARAFAAFMERALSDPELAGVRDEMMCDGVDQFADLMRAGAAAGVLCADIDVDLALSGLVGTFIFRRFMTNQPVDEEVAGRVIDHFLEQYAPR